MQMYKNRNGNSKQRKSVAFHWASGARSHTLAHSLSHTCLIWLRRLRWVQMNNADGHRRKKQYALKSFLPVRGKGRDALSACPAADRRTSSDRRRDDTVSVCVTAILRDGPPHIQQWTETHSTRQVWTQESAVKHQSEALTHTHTQMRWQVWMRCWHKHTHTHTRLLTQVKRGGRWFNTQQWRWCVTICGRAWELLEKVNTHSTAVHSSFNSPLFS